MKLQNFIDRYDQHETCECSKNWYLCKTAFLEDKPSQSVLYQNVLPQKTDILEKKKGMWMFLRRKKVQKTLVSQQVS